MMKDEYIKNLENLKNDLEKIKEEVENIKISTDWNSLRVIPLLNYIDVLIKALSSYPYEEFLNENFIEIIKLDLEYFSKNLEGLKKLLDSEKKYFVQEDKGFRRAL